jgi:hypothetical protein
METWVEIEDFPNYEVSDFGNVRNSNTGLILKPRPIVKTDNYTCYDVCLYNDTRSLGFHHKIHRLVANAFIPKVDGKPEIDHIDRNPANNNVNNLRWSNRSDNSFNTNTRSDNALNEKNIYQTKQRPHLFYVKKTGYKAKSFKTLEEAVIARDALITIF